MLNPDKALDAVLLSLGFSSDYEPTYSLQHVGRILIEEIDFTEMSGGDKDIRWMANRFVRALREADDNCVDNYRAARVIGGKIPYSYQLQVANGCCGFCDIRAVNPHTGNEYIFGFNYGH